MKKYRETRLRVWALVLSALMCISLIPAGVFAEGEEHVHTMEYKDKVEATCTNSGMEAHYHCTTCDKLFSDAEGKTEVTGQDLIIPILEHSWDEGKEIRQATPKQTGLIEYTCTVCGATNQEEYEYIEPVNVGQETKKFTLNGYKLQFKQKVVTRPESYLVNASIKDIWLKAQKKSMKIAWQVPETLSVADGIFVLRKTGKSKLYKQVAELAFKKYPDGVEEWVPKKSYTDKTAKKKNTAYSYIIIPYLCEDDHYYIGKCSDYAAGVTTASKLKNAYKCRISQKSLDLQYNMKSTLKASYKQPKKVYDNKNFRWVSDDTNVVRVNKKGLVRGAGVGETTVRVKLPSGKSVKCNVSVVGAFKPDTPTIKVDVANESSITLNWSAEKYANSYELYKSNDGVKWNKPIKVKGTTKKVTGLTKGHTYYFYVVARNDNYSYTALSSHSNVVHQKAVIKRRPTTVTGFPTSKKLTTGTKFSVRLNISSPDGRRAALQKMVNKKWVTQKTVTLPKGAGTVPVTILFPNSWWGGTSQWRLVIPRNNTSEEYISKTLTIKSGRVYQNPSQYVQITDTISKHGYNYYTNKVLVNSSSTKSDHIEAFIKTANKYMGDTYISGKTGAPGKGIDGPGLVIEACYGAGVDLWPISPATRPQTSCSASIFQKSKLGHITYTEPPKDSDNYVGVNRGDLIFFYTGKKLVGHVAIYLGYGKILHASMVHGKVEVSTIRALTDQNGSYKYSVAGVRRIFN